MKIIEMNNKGDEAQTFDMADATAVDAAMARFAELTGMGMLASVPAADGHSGRKIKTFDPTAETIIFRRQVIGG